MDVNSLSDYELVVFNNTMSHYFYEFIKLDRVFEKIIQPIDYKNEPTDEPTRKIRFTYTELASGNDLLIILDKDLKDQGMAYSYVRPIQEGMKLSRKQENSSLKDVNFIRYPCGYEGKLAIDSMGWSRKALMAAAVAMRKADPIKFDQLWSSLKISETAQAKEKARVANNKKSKDNRSERFSVPEQRYIAERFMSAILGSNYLAQLAGGQIKSDQLDKSGESIVDALKVFNISPEKLFDGFATHKSQNRFDDKNAAALRRFILQFSNKDYTSLGLIDDNELVRLAAEKKNKKRAVED